MIKPTPEAFEQWRSSPTTQWVMDTFLAAEMARTKAVSQERAWNGVLDNESWTANRERYETLEWVRSLDMEVIAETLEKQES